MDKNCNELPKKFIFDDHGLKAQFQYAALDFLAGFPQNPLFGLITVDEISDLSEKSFIVWWFIIPFVFWQVCSILVVGVLVVCRVCSNVCRLLCCLFCCLFFERLSSVLWLLTEMPT